MDVSEIYVEKCLLMMFLTEDEVLIGTVKTLIKISVRDL